MGNRGCLHDAEGRIRRQYAGKRWIICVLEFKGRRRQVMAPGRYTELFFLDEATALAAGHRPCAECQRDRSLEFRRHWRPGPGRVREAVSVDEMDQVLHTERLDQDRRQRTSVEPLADLPDGAMVADENHAYVVHRRRLLPWTPAEYGAPKQGLPTRLRVLTPPSIVAALRRGYPVHVHPSAP